MKPYSRRILFGIVYVGLVSAVSGSPGATYTFSNTNFISINDSSTPPTTASPYPSTNLVTGLAGQVVTKVTVALQGFSHGFPSDVDILLVGPQGQKAIVMANVGGQDAFSVTNLTLTLDDAAATSLPLDAPLTSGTFRPTNGYQTNLLFDFPAPAPPGNSNSVSALSVFNNSDPSGPWSLFVVDNVNGDSGSISNGWSLNLSVAVPLQIARFQTNVVVSWPASVTNSSLQFVTNLLSSGAWSNVTTAPVLISGQYAVTNRILPGNMFYRLLVH